MILAITLAPTFDLTYKVDEIKIREINTVNSKVRSEEHTSELQSH